MASIKIHQDIFNFERKRAGFTAKQWVCIGIAVALAVLTAVFLGYALALPLSLAAPAALCLAVFPALAGFMPLYHMPAEQFVNRLLILNKRGNSLSWQGEDAEFEKGEVTREYAKARKKEKGFECIG